LVLDLGDPAALTEAAAGCLAVACAAGPFQSLPRALPGAALTAGAHWLDIADDPGWLLALLRDAALAAAAANAGRAVLPGLSTVPALSGMLVRRCLARLTGARRARVTLFIGNRNAKGTGAVASLLASLRPGARTLSLPVGRRRAWRFATPDAALLAQELGLAVESLVAFEWEPAGKLLELVSRLPRGADGLPAPPIVRALTVLAAPLSRFGSNVGCLQAEVWDAYGVREWAALLGHGQRLAILPCALALEALLAGDPPQPGVVRPGSWPEPERWHTWLVARGLRLLEGSRRPAGHA
jgi:hypothetical protein